MSVPLFKLEAGADRYSDGSGFSTSVRVMQKSDDNEPQLQIEMVYQIPVSKWPELRATVDELIRAAGKIVEGGA